MTPKYVLSIDVGSTSTRTVLFDENAKAVCRCQKPFGGASPEPGHVEYDAEELFQVTLETLQNCVKQSGVALDRIDSVGIAVQRGTFVTWDKRTGKPAQKFISWQDTRATADCESWNESMRLKFVKKFNALWNVVFGKIVVVCRRLKSCCENETSQTKNSRQGTNIRRRSRVFICRQRTRRFAFTTRCRTFRRCVVWRRRVIWRSERSTRGSSIA